MQIFGFLCLSFSVVIPYSHCCSTGLCQSVQTPLLLHGFTKYACQLCWNFILYHLFVVFLNGRVMFIYIYSLPVSSESSAHLHCVTLWLLLPHFFIFDCI